MAVNGAAARLFVSVDADVARALAGLKASEGAFGRTTAAAHRYDNSMRRVGRGTVLLNKATKLSAMGVVAAGVGAGVAAVKWESAFTGVKKTVNASTQELAKMETGLRKMALTVPTSATELARIAEAAGQLGIEKKNILSFTRVIADLGVATNLTGEEGATALARLANITKMNERDFDRLGSTVVALGNAGASTEAEIVDMGLRIAGAGEQVGISEAQILSYANAMSSLGIEAELGGSAISRVFVTLEQASRQGGDGLELISKTAGMTGAQFKQSFERDAAGATRKFIEGLGKIKKKGGDVFGTLETLKLDGIRVRDTLLRMAGSGDVLRESLAMGDRAWQQNSALTEEAGRRYDTTASKIQLLKNNINEAGITMGNSMLPAINTLARLGVSAIQSETAMRLLGIAAGALAGRMIALGVVWSVGKIGAFVAALGQVRAALQLVTLAATTGQMAALPGMFAAAGGSIAAMMGPLGLIAGAAAAAALAFGLLWTNATSAGKAAADALRAARDETLSAAEADQRKRESALQLERAEKRLKDVRADDKSSRLERRQAAEDMHRSALQLQRDTIAAGDAQKRMNDAMAKIPQILESVVRIDDDKARQAIQTLLIEAAELDKLDPVIEVLASTGSAEAKAAQLSQLLGRVVKPRDVAITASTGAAMAALQNVKAKLDSINSKTVAVTIQPLQKGPHKGVPIKPEIGRATGGRVHESLTLVGERGPELVSLPTGSYVHTAGETRRMIEDLGIPGMAKGGKKTAAQKKAAEKRRERLDKIERQVQRRVGGIEFLAHTERISEPKELKRLSRVRKTKGLRKGAQRDITTRMFDLRKEIGEGKSRALDLAGQRSMVGQSPVAQAQIAKDMAQRHLDEARRRKDAEAIASAELDLTQTTADLADAQMAAAQAARQSAIDNLDAGVALAALTPAIEDDLAAFKASEQYWRSELTRLQTDAIADSEQGAAIAEAARNIKSASDSIASTAESVSNNTAALKDLTDEMTKQRELSERTHNVNVSEVNRMFMDWISGQLGGRGSASLKTLSPGAKYA